MRANSLNSRGTSGIAVVALALLLASCIKSTPTYKISGTVSSVTGAGQVLQNNGGDNLAISASGPFTFSKQLKKGASYKVTVFVQPSGQACTVTNASGTVQSNVTDVAVNCAGVGFTVGGSVSGLTGAGLVLQNGGNSLAIAADSQFTFPTLLSNGATYNVAVLTQPTGQGCSVANGNGTIAGANVTTVAVTCAAAPAAPSVNPIGFGVKELQFSWTAVSGATFYRLLENPDGVSGYAPVATNITGLSYKHAIPVHRRVNASYEVEACNAGGCSASAPLGVAAGLTQAIGYVKASNTGAADQFGFTVAVSGDGNTIAVGAPNEDSTLAGVTAGSVAAGDGSPSSGVVYVFAKVAGAWTQQAYVKASNAEANDAFGNALALSGDGNTLVVGARAESGALPGVIPGSVSEATAGGNGASNSGAVYVYTRTAGNWSQHAYVKASNPEANDLFGSSVALSADGNTLAVAAPNEASDHIGVTPGVVSEATAGNGAPNSGAVYVFIRSGSTWSQQAYVKASNPESQDVFGSSVALSGNGNTLAVGAPNEGSDLTGVTPNSVDEATAGNNAFPNAGAVYVYSRAGTTWSQQAYVKASNTESGDSFGTAVSLSSDGNTLAVGAVGEDSSLTGVTPGSVDETTAGNAAPFAGAVYVYARSAGAWSQQAYVKASNSDIFDFFGGSVALSGDGNTLAVAAPNEASLLAGVTAGSVNEASAGNPAFGAGAVYLYSRIGGTWSQEAYVKASNTENDDNFGTALAISGDGNTLAVGAQFEGGSNTGVSNTPDLSNLARKSGAAYLY